MEDQTDWEQLEFHDLPVTEIRFETAGELAFIVAYERYDEERMGYLSQEIGFHDVISLEGTALSLLSSPELEISSLDLQQSDHIEVSLRFLTAFGAPSWEVKLVCRRLSMR